MASNQDSPAARGVSRPTKIPPNTGPVVVTSVICLVVASMLWSSLNSSGPGRYMPLIVGIPTGLLALLTLGLDVKALTRGRSPGHRKEPKVEAAPTPAPDIAIPTLEHDEKHALSELQVWVWLGTLFALFWLLGMVVAGFVFIVVYMRKAGQESIGLALTIAVGTMGLVQVVLVQLLGAQVYRGYMMRELWPMLVGG